jgi:hypothetical protein
MMVLSAPRLRGPNAKGSDLQRSQTWYSMRRVSAGFRVFDQCRQSKEDPILGIGFEFRGGFFREVEIMVDVIDVI